MKANCLVFTVWCFIVAGIYADTKKESAVEGEPFTLRVRTDNIKQQQDTVLWNYEDDRIAQINKDFSASCSYDGPDGKFRDRLKMDYETGYLTITETRLEDAGRYEAEIIGSKSLGKSQSLNRNSKCDSTKIIKKSPDMSSDTTIDLSVTAVPGSGLSTAVVAAVSFAVLLVCVVSAVGVMYLRRRSSRNDTEKLTGKRLLEKQDREEVVVACENQHEIM
ncbi:uncharacterized protein LOC120486633 isoform X2 [Pimephales promelas]|uniref:uncharacterized protein LOC120486633 isoform X2 n=1 Tax=Pimephales promelas TaxID=90988 RepID=UPI0019555645|nr:uncharacterized protein LOC120486633 isoform X2 [Pimephales promelas]